MCESEFPQYSLISQHIGQTHDRNKPSQWNICSGELIIYYTSLYNWSGYIIAQIIGILHKTTVATCRYTLKYDIFKNTISHMSVCTNWQHIQCIIIMVILNISLNQTQLEINNMLRFFLREKYATKDILSVSLILWPWQFQHAPQ